MSLVVFIDSVQAHESRTSTLRNIHISTFIFLQDAQLDLPRVGGDF